MARSAHAPAPPFHAVRYTSRQAARLSGVPFFTVDYWDRSRFLRPTVSRGSGRGRGHERMYSFADVIRLRVARELRDQSVSLLTLRRVVTMLGRHADELPSARYVLVGKRVEFARTPSELLALLRRPAHRVFAVLLDLTDLSRSIEARARSLSNEKRGSARFLLRAPQPAGVGESRATA